MVRVHRALRLIAVGALTVVSCTNDEITSPASTSRPTSPDTTHSGPAPTSTSEPPTTTLAPSTTSTSTTVAPATIERPIVDPTTCEPRTVWTHDLVDATLTLFAISREAPIPIQIIGYRQSDSFDAFALVERFFTSDFIGTGGAGTISINGNDVSVHAYDNGNGEARWRLPDGSIANLRARGLDQASLEEIVGRLSPRERSAAIPGFDFDASGETRFELLHEDLNTGLNGHIATLQCLSPATGFDYHISAIDADPIAEYAGVIDRPVPLEVGTRDGALIVINGRSDPTAPTVADVTNADTATWAALVAASPTGDPLAGWPPPPSTVPALTDVPYLLPTAVINGEMQATRREHADDAVDLSDYFQVWFQKGPGAVVLTIETDIGPLAPADGDVVQVAGWDRAVFARSAPRYEHLLLASPSGSVNIWAHGLDRSDLTAIASTLTRRTGPGWNVGDLPHELTAVYEGWSLGAASRTIRSTTPEPTFELSIVHGVPSIFTTPGWFEATIDFADVGGHTAVVWQTDDRTALVWSPEPDLTVLLGYIGSASGAVDFARSLQPVERTAWRATTTPDTSSDDCSSMFC